MPIELRIQSGARAGVSQTFDKSVIALGRHPMCDLRFDANQDLDVSTRHGEIRALDGRYAIHDLQSTNGTFVNGLRVPAGGSLPLRDRDVIAFGLEGPKLSVHIGDAIGEPPPPRTVPKIELSPTDDASAFAAQAPKRGRTSERVALAVRQQTRRLRVVVIVAIVLLGGVTGAMYWKTSREAEKSARDAAERDARIRELMAANEEVNRELKTRLQGDTLLTKSLQRHNDSLTRAVREARSAAQAAAASSALIRSHDLQRKFVEMGLPAVREANDPGVVLLSTEVGGQPYEASGFSATSSGVIVTNRHVVSDSTGQRASRISIKFANSRTWHSGRILKLPGDPSVDLALVQVEDGGPRFPAVHEIAPMVDSPVGSSIATIGFPLGSDLPMGGAGLENVARTSLTVGTISKSVSGVLQIDAFASHGSSGSPVFDAHGHVIGVVWGGAKDAPGRIVFAVPADQIRELLTGVK